MAAGTAQLQHLIAHADVICPELEATTKAIAEGVATLAAARIPLITNRIGSIFTWFFTPKPTEGNSPYPVDNFEQAATSGTAAFARFHRAMLNAGVWLPPPGQYEAAFLSTAHGPEEIAFTLAAARQTSAR